jgi:hypothetical protein
VLQELARLGDDHVRVVRGEAEETAREPRHVGIDLDRVHLPAVVGERARRAAAAQAEQQHAAVGRREIGRDLGREHVRLARESGLGVHDGVRAAVDQEVAEALRLDHAQLGIGTLDARENAGRHALGPRQREQREHDPSAGKDRGAAQAGGDRGRREQRDRDRHQQPVHAQHRDQQEAGGHGGRDARQRRDREQVAGDATHLVHAARGEPDRVRAHHAEQRERREEEQHRRGQHRGPQAEAGGGVHHRSAQPGNREHPEPGAREHQREPRSARVAQRPAAAERVARSECRERDGDQRRPQEQAHAVKRAEHARAEDLEHQHRGAGERDDDEQRGALHRARSGAANDPGPGLIGPSRAWRGSRRTPRSAPASLRWFRGCACAARA